MISSYPRILSALALSFAILVAQAQQSDYASLTKRLVVAPFAGAATTEAAPAAVVIIKARAQSKVVLNWAPQSGSVSHYKIERSTNGYTFYEAGIYFTGENGNEQAYTFTDDLRVGYGGALYYRLRVVAMDGTERITPVTSMRPAGGANLLTH